ncbi:MAG TPA: NAD(P)/FAD-dependent oxidoreductase [Candidatus Limnocylindrales bacterium]|nr:NAD(P)/FAD-dependent oxidoreductase [Candidatus Limnocylindrales bacterium]
MYDVIVIGAGIIGTFVARELSRYNLRIGIVEKTNDVANGTTKANSAIIHCGYDAMPGTLKAKFNVLGNPMFDQVCKELDVPFKRVGSLVVAFAEEELKTLEDLYNRGLTNGIKTLKLLTAEETKKLEPNLNDTVQGALYAPDCGIIGPFELAIALAENAIENGATLLLNQEVTGIEQNEDGFKVITQDREMQTKYVVNCAGVFADQIYNMVTPADFKITPRRGQYFVLDKTAGSLCSMPIFQCPNELGKGILILPTVHGNILVGPDAKDIEDKTDLSTERERLEYIRETARKTSDKIPFEAIITSFAGLRATPSNGDFIIGESDKVKGFINVAGIESPGLSASPAIAAYVVEIIKEIAGGLEKNVNFNPHRREYIIFSELSSAEKSALIKKDPRYGRVVCRCEQVTEGEIVDVIHRKAGATTVDGVKRRARPGMGRCQGGFCSPRVIEVLARELDVDMSDIVKDSIKSKILTGVTKLL